MTLADLGFDSLAGHDIHLLPGLVSPPLAQFLLADEQNPATGEVTRKPVLEVPNVMLRFKAHFNGAPSNFGVTLNEDTGEVTVDSSFPEGRRLRTFLVTAKANQGANSASTKIRVYVHERIAKIWLTPSPLTVRFGGPIIRFSVRARFDHPTKGLIGDISNWSPYEVAGPGDAPRTVHTASSPDPLLSWSTTPDPTHGLPWVTVQPITGWLSAAGEDGESVIRLHYSGQTVEGVARCGVPWSTPVGVQHIVPSTARREVVGPGVAGMADVPNILFLPEGFQEGERWAFERLVRDSVDRLVKNGRYRPFGYLRINYFMAWVPSPDSGISTLNEVYGQADLKPRQPDHVMAAPVEQVDANPPSDDWTLEELIEEVGLPNPAYDLPAALIKDKVAEWAELYNPLLAVLQVQHLHADWLERASRRLVEERDTAFHFATGGRPKRERSRFSVHLLPHPERVGPQNITTFLAALHGPNGPGHVLPKVWSDGKDSALVVFLCRSRQRAGTNTPRGNGRMLSITLSDSFASLMRPVTGRGFEVVPGPPVLALPPATQAGLVHELGHSWALRDEYGGLKEPAPAFMIQIIRRSHNLQARETLVDDRGMLDADKVKWGRWPRILKAGVLREELEPDLPGHFIATLVSNHAAGLEIGDIVRLRTRPLYNSTGPSGRFRVVDVDGDQVTILALPGTNLAGLVGLFPPAGAVSLDGSISPGSILFEAARAMDPNPAAGQYGDDLMLMTQAVRERINFTHNPLNAQPMVGEGTAPEPHDFEGRACPNLTLDIPTGATNFPDRIAPNPPRFSSWTIGLFENGFMHNCGIYHPTGACLMGTHAQETKAGTFTYDYCLVCRYAIVDVVDPTRHGFVEADYFERYERFRP